MCWHNWNYPTKGHSLRICNKCGITQEEVFTGAPFGGDFQFHWIPYTEFEKKVKIEKAREASP